MQSTKKILLLVSGMSPQIITETLYALITQPQPWVPDEVHLITIRVNVVRDQLVRRFDRLHLIPA